jgi:hypothetical protein
VNTIKEVYPEKQAILELKEAIKELAWQGEDLHAGPLLDLSAVLSKIVWTYEHKGIRYALEKYTPELLAPKNSHEFNP